MAVRFKGRNQCRDEIYYKLELGNTQVSGPADGRFFGGCRIIGHGNLHHMNTEIHGRVHLLQGLCERPSVHFLLLALLARPQSLRAYERATIVVTGETHDKTLYLPQPPLRVSREYLRTGFVKQSKAWHTFGVDSSLGSVATTCDYNHFTSAVF